MCDCVRSWKSEKKGEHKENNFKRSKSPLAEQTKLTMKQHVNERQYIEVPSRSCKSWAVYRKKLRRRKNTSTVASKKSLIRSPVNGFLGDKTYRFKHESV